MINYVKGNLFELLPKTDSVKIIPHCCNNEGFFGAGFAKAVKDKWYDVYFAYHGWSFDNYDVINDSMFELGQNQWVLAQPEEGFFNVVSYGRVYVVNMIGQDNVGPDKNGNPPIRYKALDKCMESIKNRIIKLKPYNKSIEIHTVKFGAGLAGGDWSVIEKLIEKHWNDISTTIYTLE